MAAATSIRAFHAHLRSEDAEIDQVIEHLIEAFETGDQKIAVALAGAIAVKDAQ